MSDPPQSRLPGRAYDLARPEHDFAPWPGPPRRSIVLCTIPRSGSTLLGEALYFAGGLGCPLEYFHRGFRPYFEARWNTTGTDQLKNAVWRWRTDASGTLSIKLFWRDVEDLAGEMSDGPRIGDPADATADDYRALFGRIAPLVPNPVFVHLCRRDEVRGAVSGLMAADSGVWRSLPGKTNNTPRPVAYDYERIAGLIAYARHCHAHWRGFFAANGIVPFVLTYEELTRDYTETVARLLRHLGSEAPVPQARLRRQSGAQTESFALRFLQENAARQEV